MAELRSAYTKEEIKEATRLLLQIRDDCVKIDTAKYNALNMAIDGLQLIESALEFGYVRFD